MKIQLYTLLIICFVSAQAFASPGEEGPIAELTEVTVGYMPILPVAQCFIVEGLDWAKDAGLRFDMVRFPNGPAMVQALASGKLDIMYFGIGPAMVARSRGIDIKVLASNIVEQIAFIADPKLASHYDAADPATMFSQFQTKENRRVKIATFPTGSVPDTVLKHWIIEMLDMDIEDVEILAMGADQVLQAMLAGKVDAAAILEPVLTIVQERRPDIRVLARSAEMFPNQPGAVLAVRSEFMEAHPEQIEKLVALHIKATDYLVENPQEAASVIQKFIGQGLVPVETIEKALRSPSTNFISDVHAIIEPTETMYRFQLEQGSIQQELDLSTLFDTSVYDRVQ